MQITLTPAGIAAANAANMSGLTITISKFRVYRSNVAEVSLPYITTGLEDLTTLAAWTWLPAATEFDTLEEFEPLDPNTVQLVCKLDETVGDFDYDILTLWLDDGTFFGLAANRFLWKKFQAGNPPANQHKIHVSFTFTNAAATTNINIDNAKWSFDFIPEVNSVDDLVKAGLAIHRMYRCTRRMGTGDDATGVRSFLVQSGKAAFDAQAYQRNEWIPSDYRLVYIEDLLPTVDTHLSNVAFQKDVSRVVFKFNTNGAYNAAQLSSLDPKSVILSMAYPDGTNQGLLRHVSSISVLSDGSGVWVALNLLTPLPNIPTSYVPVKVYTCQTDRQIPAPSAAGKLLTSTQADVGYGHTWEDPAAITLPYATNIVLVGYYGSSMTTAAIIPINGGAVTINDVTYVLSAPITIGLGSLTVDQMYSVFLYNNAGTLTALVEILPTMGTPVTMPKRNSKGVTVRYLTGPSTYDDDKIFVGHVYRNVAIDYTQYRNLARYYVRSYHNDYGTMGAGYQNSNYDEPGSFQRDGRVRPTARFSGTSQVGTSGIKGLGGSANEVPDTSFSYPATPQALPPTRDVVIGCIMWPYEQITVQAQFDAFHAGYPGDGMRYFQVRTWNVQQIVGSPPPPATPVTNLQAIVLGTTGLTNIDDANGSYLRNTNTLTSNYYRDVGIGDAYKGSFQVFDMWWEPSIICYGTDAPGDTRITIRPSQDVRLESLSFGVY